MVRNLDEGQRSTEEQNGNDQGWGPFPPTDGLSAVIQDRGYQEHSRDVKLLSVLIRRSATEGRTLCCGRGPVWLRLTAPGAMARYGPRQGGARGQHAPHQPPTFHGLNFTCPTAFPGAGCGRPSSNPPSPRAAAPRGSGAGREPRGAARAGRAEPGRAVPYRGGARQRSQQHPEPGCRDAAAEGRGARAAAPSPRRRAKLNSQRDSAAFLSPPGSEPPASPPTSHPRPPCRCHHPARAAGKRGRARSGAVRACPTQPGRRRYR